MKTFKVMTIKENVMANNQDMANQLRTKLKNERVFLLNLMSSPGSGKTTTIERTIEGLGSKWRLGIMEADIDSDVDAIRVAKKETKVIQLHTGGMCHLDAHMTQQGLEGLGTEDVDLCILENVGNLVCPAEFDTGAVKNAMILSVPEGDDKPLKYPLMFETVDVVLINKVDVMPYFNFNFDQFKANVAKVNPKCEIIMISALKNEGLDAWYTWLDSQVSDWLK